MHKNVGSTDALIRITGGLMGLAYGIGRMSRRPHNAPWLLLSLSAMKVAEGVTRFCPMYAATGINTHSKEGMRNIVTRAKEAGMQAGMQAVMKRVSSSMDMTNTAKTHGTTDQDHNNHALEHHGDRQPAHSPRLSESDQMLENAVRQFVSFDGKDNNPTAKTKATFESYAADEHRYPTYS